MDVDDASAVCEEEEDGAWDCNKLLDELELRKVSILRCMAKKWTDPRQLHEKMRRFSRTANDEDSDENTRHRQSK